jgi:hypothetical protein
MATTTFTYASQANFKDYFPHLQGSDNKSPVYNWSLGYENFHDTSLDIYYANNTGLIDTLFFDGAKIDKIAFNTTETTQVKVAITPYGTSIDVDDTSAFGSGDIIKVNNEYMRVGSVTDGDTLSVGSGGVTTLTRGLFGTNAQHHAVDSSVYKIIDVSADVGDSTQADPDGLSFLYDSDLDLSLLITNSQDPNNYVIESGSDFKTYMDNQLYRASMELNNMLDGRFPNPIPKAFIHSDTPSTDTAQYDAIIVKLTCYIAAVNMLRASTDYEQAEIIQNEITNIDNTGMVDKLNAGQFKLAFEIDKTDSSGDIIEVTNTGSMNLVETYGEWTGMRYDRVQLICTTAGAYGTARMTIKTYDGNNLYGAETLGWEVTGGLDHIGNGLYVRFEGNSMAENDRWDIEVRNYTLKQSNSQGTRSIDSIRNDLSQSKIIRRKRIY